LIEGIVLHHEQTDSIVGIDIDNASKKVDLQELMVTKIPFSMQTITG